jgi:ssDNA-binding Zn-finger/Zn-ribbon topoisomerase 1
VQAVNLRTIAVCKKCGRDAQHVRTRNFERGSTSEVFCCLYEDCENGRYYWHTNHYAPEVNPDPLASHPELSFAETLMACPECGQFRGHGHECKTQP